ncbi:hypothetical protein D1BOALGB6SA_6936 [Olavius sp. associated proteobacterium Delta 1]|nr:hypothetical protein D1BOALGB6SA_6936 [Olavius sp. associated proteobacterium Delta 1]
MRLKLIFGIPAGLIILCLLGNSTYAQPSKTLNIPNFVTSVPYDHFAGVSPPMLTIDKARNLAVADVVRQVLGAIGINYHYSYTGLVSGSPYKPKRIIDYRLSSVAHGVVMGVEQNMVQSSWARDQAGNYVYFVLVRYPNKLVREMRRLSKGAKVVVSLISNDDGLIILKVTEVNGVGVTLTSADVTVKKKNRFEPFLSFCIWKVPKSSVRRFKKAITPVSICRGSSEVGLQIKGAAKRIEDYLLGAKIKYLAVLKGHDELGRAVSTKISF